MRDDEDRQQSGPGATRAGDDARPASIPAHFAPCSPPPSSSSPAPAWAARHHDITRLLRLRDVQVPLISRRLRCQTALPPPVPEIGRAPFRLACYRLEFDVIAIVIRAATGTPTGPHPAAMTNAVSATKTQSASGVMDCMLTMRH
jgi:hypothetical protein